MIETIKDIAPALAVVTAVLGVIAAFVKRRQTVTYRHEVDVRVPFDSARGSREARGGGEVKLYAGVSIVGSHLCVDDQTIPLSAITGVRIQRTPGIGGWLGPLLGAFMLMVSVADPPDWRLAIFGGIFLLGGLWVWSIRRVDVLTSDGGRHVIAKNVSAGRARSMRNRILAGL